MSESDCRSVAEKFTLLMEKAGSYRNKYFKTAVFSNIKKQISNRQFTILCILAYSNKNTVSQLAKIMGISKSTLSIIMGKMIKNNYLIKTYPDEGDDKRKTYFSVSDTGMEILEAVKKERFEELKYIYNSLNVLQREYMRLAFGKLACIVKNDSELFEALSLVPDKDDEIGKIIYSQNLFLAAFIQQTGLWIKEEFKKSKNNDNLTRNQCYLLVCIAEHKYNTITKLENYLNSSGSTVSITVSKLVKGGYVIKEYPSGDDDGRLVYLKVTKKGCDKLNEMKNKLTQIFYKYISELDEKDRSSVSEGLDMLLLAFDN